MKRFIFNSILFILILPAALHIIPLYLLYTEKYKQTVTGSEIYQSIKKSKQKSKTKKLLLGDSVGNQLFPNTSDNDNINSLACNQTIGMVGQFLLLNNYLNAGNQIDTLLMLFSPFSFANNLDQLYTYQYFVKPFFNDEYKVSFTETVTRQIHKIPYVNFCRVPLILTSNWAPDFSTKDEINYTFLSPISVEYLAKIKALATKHNFALIILPVPTSISKKSIIDKMNRNEDCENDLANEFNYYFEHIIYLEDENFSDGVHLKKPQTYTEYFTNKFLKY